LITYYQAPIGGPKGLTTPTEGVQLKHLGGALTPALLKERGTNIVTTIKPHNGSTMSHAVNCGGKHPGLRKSH